MSLADVANITALTRFQMDIKRDIEKLLIAYYGDNYKEILAKGRLTGDEKTLGVLNALEKIERDLGIKFAKGDNL